ncbi:MAG TPA: hypothetical protein VF210_07155 [Pseudomonadales bacterium]
MSRSLVAFLIFCLLLVIVTGGVVWYVGPTLAGIVVDEAKRERPYYLLQLLPARAAEPGAAASYRSRFAELAAKDGGRVLWLGGKVEVMEGSVLLDIAGLQLVEFPTGADLVQMFTGRAFRDLENDVGAALPRHLGTSVAPRELAPDAATVAVLYRAETEDGNPPLGKPGERGWLALLPSYHGEVRWDAPVSSIAGRSPWNRVLLVQFPDRAAAEGWLADPITATERAIAGKAVDEMVVLSVQPSQAAPRWNSRTVRNSSNSPRLGYVDASISPIGR